MSMIMAAYLGNVQWKPEEDTAILNYRGQCYVITACIIQPSRSELSLRCVFSRE